MILLKFHEIQFTLDLLANLAGGSSEQLSDKGQVNPPAQTITSPS